MSPPSFLFVGGPIYPMATGHPFGQPLPDATALLTRGSTIAYIGPEAGLDRAAARAAEIVDLAGRPLFPGFCDAHLHLVLAAEQHAELDCQGAETIAALQTLLSERVHDRPAGAWITGFGWEKKTLFADDRPRTAALDDVTTRHPVFLVSKDLHSAWLNSAGIDRLLTLPDPPPRCAIDHTTVRDQGLVYEDIFELRKRLIPQRDEAQKRALLGPFVAHLHAHGITTVHCNDPVEDFRLAEAHLAAAATSERVRVLHNLVFDTPQALREQRALYRQGLAGWLCPGGTKLILDGSLGSLSAAVSRPYRDASEHPRGIVNYDEDELDDWLAAIHEVGTHAVLHCIGDRAAALAIDGLRRLSWPAGTLHRLEHVQLLSDAIVAGGFAGLALSVQPSHMWGDREIVARRVDPALARRWAYAYRTMQQRGGLIVFGSDAPVERVDPWPGIAAAVTRLADDSTPPWIAEEALPLGEAIAAHTAYPARLHGHGLASGALAAGHRADLVVFEEDPFARLSRAPTALKDGVAVSLTLLDGEPVYRGRS